MTARSVVETTVLTILSSCAAVSLTVFSFWIVGRPEVDVVTAAKIALSIAIVLTPVFVFPLVKQRRRMLQLSAKFKQLALEDDLTRLANRRAFFHQVNAAVADGVPGQRFAMLMMDLDQFKNLNDTYGHAVGDAALVHAAEQAHVIIHGLSTSIAIIGRLGGEEFAVFLSGADAESAPAIAEALCSAVRKPLLCEGHTIRITASIGICVADGSTSIDYALKMADDATYEAKAAGRNQWKLMRHRADRFGSGLVA